MAANFPHQRTPTVRRRSMTDAPVNTSAWAGPKTIRVGLGWLLIVGTACSSLGCMQTLAKGAKGLDVARRERMIAEKIKNDPFPNAAEAGVTTGTP